MKRKDIISTVISVVLIIGSILVLINRDAVISFIRGDKGYTASSSNEESGDKSGNGTGQTGNQTDGSLVSNGQGVIGFSRYTATIWDLFETVTELAGYEADQETFELHASIIEAKLKYYHQLYDIYNNYDGVNNLKTINDNAGIGPVKVDSEIIEMLKLSRVMYDLTDGATNVAMGAVLRIWHQYRDEGINDPDHARLPKPEELEAASRHCDISKMIIDEEASTVYLEDPEMSLDVGSVGKGYAVQKIADYARACHMKYMLISVGGNVCVLDQHPDGKPWKLGVQNPNLFEDKPYVGKVNLPDGSCIVSSGNYQRYYFVDGVRYCHIIDPDTLYPADFFAQVSVVTSDSGAADALSTALYTMPVADGLAFVEKTAGLEAMWVGNDGEITYSSGFEKYLAE